MRIDIHASSFELTDAIESHAQSRIALSLGAAADRIDSTSVRLSDINGSHGGVDKRCRIVVSMPLSPDIVAESVSPDLYAAIDEATSRIKDSVWRQIKRKRDLHKSRALREARRLRA